MSVILCQNKYLDEHGARRDCGRFLAALTPDQVLSLRKDSTKFMVLRCPMCKPDQRWIKVSSVNGKLTFSLCPDRDRPNFDDKVIFDECCASEQVA